MAAIGLETKFLSFDPRETYVSKSRQVYNARMKRNAKKYTYLNGYRSIFMADQNGTFKDTHYYHFSLCVQAKTRCLFGQTTLILFYFVTFQFFQGAAKGYEW